MAIITRNLCRIIVGIVFIYSGFVKGIDPLGSMYKFIEYFNAAGLGSMDAFALFAAFALSLFEFLVGIALLLNLYTHVAAPAAFLFMLFFTPLTLYIALAEPVSDCGCFGDALVLTGWQSFWKNVLLLCLTGIIHADRRRFTPALSTARQFGLLLLPGIYIFGLSFYSYNTLPVLDFRPYAVGKNISEQMRTPDGAEPNRYEITLFYKNRSNGEIKAFTEENYPWQDTAWVHERTEHRLLQKGHVPPVHDFSIDHPQEGDITQEVLESGDYILLVVMRRLEEISRKTQSRINRLAYYLQERGYRLVGLTSSSSNEIAAFSERYGLPYDICSSDDTQLKTMIRSTPGILLLHKGTILGKWPGHHIPEVADLAGADFAAHCINRGREQRENLLLSTLFFLFSTTYLLFPPSRRKRQRR